MHIIKLPATDTYDQSIVIFVPPDLDRTTQSIIFGACSLSHVDLDPTQPVACHVCATHVDHSLDKVGHIQVHCDPRL